MRGKLEARTRLTDLAQGGSEGAAYPRKKEGLLPITMATLPGPLTEWPWQWMGNFKVCKVADISRLPSLNHFSFRYLTVLGL